MRAAVNPFGWPARAEKLTRELCELMGRRRIEEGLQKSQPGEHDGLKKK